MVGVELDLACVQPVRKDNRIRICQNRAFINLLFSIFISHPAITMRKNEQLYCRSAWQACGMFLSVWMPSLHQRPLHVAQG